MWKEKKARGKSSVVEIKRKVIGKLRKEESSRKQSI